MKLSIIIPVLNSHEIVKRQIRHFRRLRLSDDIEIIIMDDGSDPPLSFPNMGLKNFTIYPTNSTLNWSEGLAKNMGAKIAKGEMLILVDIDHILTREAIKAAYDLELDVMRFKRRFGILNRRGEILTDKKSLLDFGLSKARYEAKKNYVPSHGNSFAIRRSVFLAMGGYDKKLSGLGRQGGIDNDFGARINRFIQEGKCRPGVFGPIIYTFPIGRFHEKRDYNPFGWFHDLPRAKERDEFYA